MQTSLLRPLAVALLLAAPLPGLAGFGQTARAQTARAQTSPGSTPDSTPDSTQGSAPGAPAAGTAGPHLSVASVRLNDALRASKIIGAAVINDHNEAIGTVDDLMIIDRNRIAYVVVSVGGFLGIGSKLVAVPYDQLQPGSGNRLIWPGATKQSLNEMPSFTYGS